MLASGLVTVDSSNLLSEILDLASNLPTIGGALAVLQKIIEVKNDRDIKEAANKINMIFVAANPQLIDRLALMLTIHQEKQINGLDDGQNQFAIIRDFILQQSGGNLGAKARDDIDKILTAIIALDENILNQEIRGFAKLSLDEQARYLAEIVLEKYIEKNQYCGIEDSDDKIHDANQDVIEPTSRNQQIELKSISKQLEKLSIVPKNLVSPFRPIK